MISIQVSKGNNVDFVVVSKAAAKFLL